MAENLCCSSVASFMAKSSFPLIPSGLQGHRRGIPQDCWRSSFSLFLPPLYSLYSTLLWRLVVKGFLLMCGRLLFHGFPASLRKDKKLPHLVKSSSVVAVKEGDRMCSLAPSLLLPVPLPHPSDSPQLILNPWKALCWGASPTLPHPLPALSPKSLRPIGEKFHPWLTAAHLFTSASSSTLLRESRPTASERPRSGLLQKGVWRDKGRALGPQTTEQEPALTAHRDSTQRKAVSQSW